MREASEHNESEIVFEASFEPGCDTMIVLEWGTQSLDFPSTLVNNTGADRLGSWGACNLRDGCDEKDTFLIAQTLV
jgi:hypothetical protein